MLVEKVDKPVEHRLPGRDDLGEDVESVARPFDDVDLVRQAHRDGLRFERVRPRHRDRGVVFAMSDEERRIAAGQRGERQGSDASC